MKITQHFSSDEFKCKDGTLYPAKWIETKLRPLCKALERIRAINNQALHIDSGYRTPFWNNTIYHAMGKPPTKSKHCEGIAADISLDGVNAHQLFNAVEMLIKDGILPNGGLGLYRSWIHYDLRCTIDNEPPARWIEA